MIEGVGILAGAMIGLVLGTMAFGTAVVAGNSMQPTLHSNDHVFINKYTPARGALERGDIVFLQWDIANDAKDNQVVVKRIIGLPGDRIDIAEGQVYVNGGRLEEPYVLSRVVQETLINYVVPPESVFVLGDNRGNSDDSRDHGAVPVDYIIGKATCVIWPLNRIQRLG